MKLRTPLQEVNPVGIRRGQYLQITAKHRQGQAVHANLAAKDLNFARIKR
jgi:hypothetical protein